MRIPLEKLPKFICPKSGAHLTKKGNILTSEDGINCYKAIDGVPVLVDFENSVLEEKDFNSLKVPEVVERPRNKGLRALAKRIVSPPKRTTANNVSKLMKLLFSGAKDQNPLILIIGGGSVGQGMQSLYESGQIDVVSFDVYASKNIQFIADGHSIPFEGKTFDAVIIQAVLEHVLEPIKVVSEIYRVLKEEGFIYSETPFLQHVHEGPYDFTRYTESGHRYLFKNFSLIKSGSSAGAGTQLLWAVDIFARGLFRSRIVGKIVKLSFFWLTYLDCIIPKKFNIDAACGCYFFGKKATKAISPNDVIKHYQGAQ
jgi:SAM-dependent methyltransferase